MNSYSDLAINSTPSRIEGKQKIQTNNKSRHYIYIAAIPICAFIPETEKVIHV